MWRNVRDELLKGARNLTHCEAYAKAAVPSHALTHSFFIAPHYVNCIAVLGNARLVLREFIGKERQVR